jgi:Xaa-Pro aminopeptidase
MKRALAVLVQAASAAALFDKTEYAARRARLMEKIPDGAAVFLGAAPPARDVEFRQGHDFLYFTGVRIPNAALIVDGVRKESTLFFTMTEKEADGEGIPVDLVKNAREVTGIERVQAFEQFAAALTSLSQRTRVLYTMFKPEELGPENSNEKFNALQRSMTQSLWDGRLTRELQFVKQLRDKFPQVDVRDCSALVWELRKIKSAAELAVMRRAGRIGVQAHNALIRSTRPGVAEKGLDAYAPDFRGIVRLGGYNHMIGMATHDVAGTFAGAAEVLAPGMVFACDIQLFRLEEQIGIRIEDTIAVTDKGYENLSPGCPRTVAQIEALKKADGILQILKSKGLY